MMQNLVSCNKNEKDIINAIVNRIRTSQHITNFDRTVYCNAYGSDAVSFVEATCELMPDVDNPNNRIGAMLNISYDKGFDDCSQMVLNVLKEWGVNVE